MTERSIRFAPGSFDEFTGTQRELDDIVAQLTEFLEEGHFGEDNDIGEFVVEDITLVAGDGDHQRHELATRTRQ